MQRGTRITRCMYFALMVTYFQVLKLFSHTAFEAYTLYSIKNTI